MLLLTEMALPDLPVERPEFDKDPMPFVEAARRQHPWLAKFSQGYFVHGYQAIKDLNIMDDKLRPSFDGVVEFYGAQGTPWGRWMQEHLIAISGPQHTRIRSSIAQAFTPGSINRFRSLMRERISDLLDEWAPKGKFDFAEFSANFPISIMCGVLGTSAEAIPHIRHALEVQGRSFSLRRELLPDLLAAYDVMWSFVDKLILDREKSGPTGQDTLLDSLIATKNAGQIDELELRYLLLVLFPAGYDTSSNFFTLTMHMMLKHPDKWERCAADHDYCAKVVEEMLRYSSISSVFRTVTEEFVYADVQFPKGARLFLGNPVAGRDPTAFPDGDSFQPERVNTNRHVAFGRGAHICVGQHLARAQIVEALHVTAQRITKPRLAGEVTWRAFFGTWGPSSLPIEFEPAPKQSQRQPEAQGCPVHQPR